MSVFDQFTNADDLIEYLVLHTPESTTDDACHDAILVEYFFPLIGERFNYESDIYEDDIKTFKQQFPYEKFGLDREQSKKAIDKLRSIRAIIDYLVTRLSLEVKNELARQHLRRVWYEQNAQGNFNNFKRSIEPKYWFPQ
jgi:hypothetical protein